MNEIDVIIGYSEEINTSDIQAYYTNEAVTQIARQVLAYMLDKQQEGLVLPYFADLTVADWSSKEKELSLYVTDSVESRHLNFESRGKDYATNILSYPSDFPLSILDTLPTIPLGELIICHDVLRQQAQEQDKQLQHHLTHLLVHGILHLLGFDHELGEAEQLQMETFEIEILQRMQINNPYV